MTRENDSEQVVIKEGKAEIVFASDQVFYNPIQSISVINVFAEKFLEEPETSFNKKNGLSKSRAGITILEALAATGLRSIRYAKEIPQATKITANDFDPKAVEAIKRNILHNQVDDIVETSQGDANFIMYKSMSEKKMFDVIDLDPYGSASPFIDAAIRGVSDGGLLCVTCTDMASLAGGQSESCFAKYGGINIPNTPFCHEMGLRMLLHQLQTTASRYEKYIQPLVSLSIDFYIRVFVRVFHSPKERKLAASRTGMVFYCHGCKSFHTQSLGKVTNNESSIKYGTNALSVDSTCPECSGRFQVGGPFYMGSLHNKEFLSSLLKYIQSNTKKYKTHKRMFGMVTMANEELDVPFYYTLSSLCASTHCCVFKAKIFVSALLNKGYKFSASHAAVGSIKTDAPPTVIWDIMRSWVKKNPVKPGKDGDPSIAILSKEPRFEADFTLNKSAELTAESQKIVRYQVNPEPFWGPKAKAGKAQTGNRSKRKRQASEAQEE